MISRAAVIGQDLHAAGSSVRKTAFRLVQLAINTPPDDEKTIFRTS
jgi:hypothetical protein